MKLFDREGELTRRIAPLLQPSWSVLDVGSGNGRLAARVAASTRTEMTLCDLSARHVPGMTYLTMAQPTRLPCADQSHDVVMMLFMLHHMDSFAQQEELLLDACRVARRRLVLLEDTPVGPVERLFNKAWDYALNAPSGVPTPFTFRSTEGWGEAVERAGFSLAEVRTFRGTWPILRSYTQTLLAADARGPAAAPATPTAQG